MSPYYIKSTVHTKTLRKIQGYYEVENNKYLMPTWIPIYHIMYPL